MQDMYNALKEVEKLHVTIVCEHSEHQAVNLLATIESDDINVADLLVASELGQMVNTQVRLVKYVHKLATFVL